MGQDGWHTFFLGDDNHGLLGQIKDAGSSEGAVTLNPLEYRIVFPLQMA